MATDLTRSGSNLVIASNGTPYKTYGIDDLVSHEVVNNRLRLQFADGQFYDLDAGDLSFSGAAFSGTAAQLRDKLSSQVFNAQSTRQVLASNVPLSHTGSTVETTVYTGTIPGGSIGLNGSLWFKLLLGGTNSANNKTVRVKINDTMILTYSFTSAIGSVKYQGELYNRNSLTAQVGMPTNTSNAGGLLSTSSGVPVVFNFNTAADMAVTITVALAVGTESTTIDAFQVIAVN
jgi:hypothetical protein